MNEKLKKFLLEALRWGVLAFVSAVLKFALENIGSLELAPNFVLLITAALRFADAGLHKSGVAEKGITRF